MISGSQCLDLSEGLKATRCKSFMFFFIHFTFWAFYRTDLWLVNCKNSITNSLRDQPENNFQWHSSYSNNSSVFYVTTFCCPIYYKTNMPYTFYNKETRRLHMLYLDWHSACPGSYWRDAGAKLSRFACLRSQQLEEALTQQRRLIIAIINEWTRLSRTRS